MAKRSGSATSSVKFHPAGHVLGSAQVAVTCKDTCIVASGDYKDAPDPTCTPFELVPCDVFITEATFGLPVFRHGDAADEVKKLLASVALFPERAHLVGAYSLGKAQRVIALLRQAGYDAPIYLHGAMEKITALLSEPRHRSRRAAAGDGREEGGARRHHRAGAALGHIRCLDAALSRSRHCVCLGLDARARPRAAARHRAAAGDFGSRRLGRPYRDHRRDRRRRDLGDPWPGRRAGALVPEQGLRAQPLDLVGYGDEEESETPLAARPRHEPLRRTSGPPRLRARPQQQAAADHQLFSRGRRSRSRLRAGGADRRAELQARQARADPRFDRVAHR